MLSTYPQLSKPPLFERLVAEFATGLTADIQQRAGVGVDDWQGWLKRYFPAYTAAPMPEGKRHANLWKWFTALTPDVKPPARIEIWSRGGAKSSTAELGTTYAGVRQTRRFALYVSGTQSQADKHLQSISTLLEQVGVDRAVNRYNQSKGWTQRILRAANGFNVVSLGLDAGVRGVKLDQYRPDLIILDDVDNRHDSLDVVGKKIETLTESILPTGAPDYAVLFIQNMVHKDSVAAQLVDGRASFLLNREPIVIEPAVHNLTYETTEAGTYRIIGGEYTWDGQNLEVCQSQINDWGLTAFLQEAQHEVDEPDGGMYSHLVYRRCKWSEVPPLVRVCVWCDPAVTNTDNSDCHGIQADGIATDGTIYRLFSWEQRTTPQDVLRRAILKAIELNAQIVGVETDQGGDTWQSVYYEAWRKLQEDTAEYKRLLLVAALEKEKASEAGKAAAAALEEQAAVLVAKGLLPDGAQLPAFRSAKAGSGQGSKVERGAKMLADYERGRFVHVEGTHIVLEKALKRFPKAKPFDCHDAAYWSWNWLAGGGMTNSAVGAFG